MKNGIATSNGVEAETVLRDCVAALRAVASYRLPRALDRRFLWLSESKEELTAGEQEELQALVEFSEERTIEKLQAKLVLSRLENLWPQLLVSAP